MGISFLMLANLYKEAEVTISAYHFSLPTVVSVDADFSKKNATS
jgi:hypothetical protein